MKIKSKKPKELTISFLIPIIGIIFLILSFLCFINIIQSPLFYECGSACEYWWTWLWNFPPQPVCILVCIPRNILYKPFFILGLSLILLDLLREL